MLEKVSIEYEIIIQVQNKLCSAFINAAVVAGRSTKITSIATDTDTNNVSAHGEVAFKNIFGLGYCNITINALDILGCTKLGINIFYFDNDVGPDPDRYLEIANAL